jgi:hypothetical protein
MPSPFWSSQKNASSSTLAFVQTVDQAGKHSRDFFEPFLKFAVNVLRHELPSMSQFQERDTFVDRSSRHPEEILAIGLCESTISFGDTGGNRERGTAQLNDKEALSA